MKKLYFIITIYILIGIAGNYIELGGKWVNTKATFSMQHGGFKDFYPIHGLIYTGYNDNDQLVLCISGRPFSDNAFDNIPPQRKDYRSYKPSEYAIILNNNEIEKPSEHLKAVSFVNRSYANEASKNAHDTGVVYSYSQRNISTECPNIGLLNQAFKYTTKDLNDIRWNIASLIPNRGYEVPLRTHLRELNKRLQPIEDNNVHLIVPTLGSGPPFIYINNEVIPYITSNGIYYYILINNNGSPLILAGGYVQYTETNYGTVNIIFSALADILAQPVKMVRDQVLMLLPWG